MQMSAPTTEEKYTELEKAVQLYEAGDREQALIVINRLADSGFPHAYYILARYARYEGRSKEARYWLALLEAAALNDNAQSCFDSFVAYRFGYTGQVSIDNVAKGSRYLLRAAELGHTYAQYTLAQELRSGANDQTKSESGYLYWIEKAITGGSDDAIYDHIKWLDQKGRDIHPSLMADLDVLAQEWPNAAKLRDKLKRRTPR